MSVMTTSEIQLDDAFDLEIKEIKVIQEGQEVTATGFLCTLFTCSSLTCDTCTE
ncbi:hypothetical protein GCM10011583_69720 [Streptomyces camponoticapitis]|uniref:Lantibiotic n=2 Tax=Streptomyces camponoticapitis TaxID=1616125 RepID=A0ABQ2EVH1_9ACTN|nr:hypothetical protein GCM10011583_69720 [Streptomyces camponoticapitis]